MILDSEEEGVFTVSCAGGTSVECIFYTARANRLQTTMSGYCVTISGLLGGHSGADVDKERGNANVLMGRLLYSAMERFPGLCLIDVQGGEFDNVIRSNCAAAVAIPVSCRKEFEVFVSSFGATLQNEYADTDANVTVSCEDTEAKAPSVPRIPPCFCVLL